METRKRHCGCETVHIMWQSYSEYKKDVDVSKLQAIMTVISRLPFRHLISSSMVFIAKYHFVILVLPGLLARL